MIPELVDVGGPWRVLPPGIHDASLTEIQLRYTTNAHRRKLFEGLKNGVLALRAANCTKIYVDGSFVTDKEMPGDYDVCWDPTGVIVLKLDPVLLDTAPPRTTQKEKYLGEFLPSRQSEAGKKSILDFFQRDKYTGLAKGILRLSTGIHTEVTE